MSAGASITPHACARGFVIGSRSVVIGHNWRKSDEFGFKALDKVRMLQTVLLFGHTYCPYLHVGRPCDVQTVHAPSRCR